MNVRTGLDIIQLYIKWTAFVPLLSLDNTQCSIGKKNLTELWLEYDFVGPADLESAKDKYYQLPGLLVSANILQFTSSKGRQLILTAGWLLLDCPQYHLPSYLPVNCFWFDFTVRKARQQVPVNNNIFWCLQVNLTINYISLQMFNADWSVMNVDCIFCWILNIPFKLSIASTDTAVFPKEKAFAVGESQEIP